MSHAVVAFDRSGRVGPRRAGVLYWTLRRRLTLAVMMAAFGSSRRATGLERDRMSEHLRRDIGLTNHVEQNR